jgi:methionine-rich copper-binding protein CopC
MAKKHQQRPAKEIVGRNNPEKSTEITTGAPKKHETYRQQAIARDDPGKLAQKENPPRSWKANPGLTHEADSRRRIEDRRTRSGSDSNADKHRKETQVKESKEKEQPQAHHVLEDGYVHDLAVAKRPAEDEGLGEPQIRGVGVPANEIKELHTKLADLTDDELNQITIVPVGTRLKQGEHYLDLQHLNQDEFVASGAMVAEPGHYYVAKNETDYVTWNRLNQVSNSARLDESAPE